MFPRLTVLLLCLSGCVNYQRVSAGEIGCPEDEIAISEVKGLAIRSWTAECRGERYQCTGPEVACTKELSTSGGETASPGSSTPSNEAGCSFDTQCKGDRVCEEGKCVEPAPKAGGPASVPQAGPTPESAEQSVSPQ